MTGRSLKVRRSEFYKMRLRVILTVDACAELCGVSNEMVERWDQEGAPFIVMRLLSIYDRQDLSGHGPDWKGFRFSRGRLVCGRLSFGGRNLKQHPHYVDLYNRLELVRLRHQDGLPLTDCLEILFASSAFTAIPDLRDE